VWKEGLIALLIVIVLLRLRRTYADRGGVRLIALDWVAIAFFAITLVYLVVPNEVPAAMALQQRLAAFRIAALIPGFMGWGERFNQSRDASWRPSPG
jgi:hypothetical protein